MKVSIITLPSGWGGTELHTVALARCFAIKGHDVQIVEIGSDLYVKNWFRGNDSISIQSVDVGAPFKLLGFFKAFRFVRSLKGNICIFPKGSFHDWNWRFDFAAKLNFSRYVTIEHTTAGEPDMPPKSSRRHCGGLIPGIGLWWYKLLLHQRLRSIGPDRTICVSSAVRERLKQYGFPERKLMTIHNGVDPGAFQHISEYRHKVRNALGIPHDALVFGSVGRYSREKSFDLALELFGQVISGNHGRDMRLVLFGDGPMYQDLAQTVAREGYQDRVLLMGPTDRPWEVYPAIDVFIMPSRTEGLPFSLLEAMACECAPIAMGVGGIPEVITGPDLGWLVQPGDRSGFLAAMNEAAELETGRLKEMGRLARQHVSRNFNADHQYSELVSHMEQGCSAAV